MKRAVLVALLVLAASAPSVASAEPKDACITAYEQTQTLRKDGKLVSARSQAEICARDTCPALLTKDCARWMTELDASTPSVVFEARSATGTMLSDVRVSVDGVVLASRLDGKPVAIDPGKHVFHFESGGAVSDERVLVREGEKNRHVRVTLAANPEEAHAAGARPIPMGVWIFGGASVVALGVSAAFALDGFAKKGSLEDCKPRCAPSDVDAMSASFTVADVALGAGIMAAAAAAYVFFTRPVGQGQTRPYARSGTGGGIAIPF